MTAITLREALRAAVEADLKVTRLSNGAVRLELKRPLITVCANNWQKPWFYDWNGVGPCDLVLISMAGKAARVRIRKSAKGVSFMRNAAVHLNNITEARSTIASVLRNATSVDNDIYVFPSSGGWLLEANHHDEVRIDVAVRVK
jgi:hypothetical protein